MRAGKLIAAAAVVALLSACSPISAGTITEKVNEPARTYVCGVKPLILCHDDEDWRFDLDGLDADGDLQHGWVYVKHETFDQYEVGDYFGGPQ